MVNLIFVEDDDALANPGVDRTLYDPAQAPATCFRWLANIWQSTTRQGRLTVYGQELNDESYAICKAGCPEERTRNKVGYPSRRIGCACQLGGTKGIGCL
jgi:hypothetical protein